MAFTVASGASSTMGHLLLQELFLAVELQGTFPIPTEWVRLGIHSLGKSRQIRTFSFYTLAVMAPGDLAALFCKDLCDYVSSTPLVIVFHLAYTIKKTMSLSKKYPVKKRINLCRRQLSTFGVYF